MTVNIHIVCSTLEQDQKYKNKLREHLAPSLKRWGENNIHITDRQDIIPGTEWRKYMSNAVGQAHVYLLFVSANMMAYCWSEMEQAVEQTNVGAKVLPIMVSPCDVQGAPFESFLRFSAKKTLLGGQNILDYVEIVKELVEGLL